MNFRGAKYKELERTLHTGDLILFHGQLPASRMTEFLQGTIWSHVGMVIRPEDIGLEYDSLLLWESNTLTNIEDAKMKKTKKEMNRDFIR